MCNTPATNSRGTWWSHIHKSRQQNSGCRDWEGGGGLVFNGYGMSAGEGGGDGRTV